MQDFSKIITVQVAIDGTIEHSDAMLMREALDLNQAVRTQHTPPNERALIIDLSPTYRELKELCEYNATRVNHDLEITCEDLRYFITRIGTLTRYLSESYTTSQEYAIECKPNFKPIDRDLTLPTEEFNHNLRIFLATFNPTHQPIEDFDDKLNLTMANIEAVENEKIINDIIPSILKIVCTFRQETSIPS